MPSINVGTLEGTDSSEMLRGGILHYPDPDDSRYDVYIVVKYILGYGGDDIIYGSPMPATQVLDGTAFTYDFGTDIYGGDGNDQIFGENRNDILGGQAGNDFIDGGDGDDFIAGNEGDDVLLGGAGNDLIHDGPGDDYVDGGAGDDVIDYHGGTASLLGGTGDDKFHIVNTASAGTVDGGDGVDTVFTGFLGGLSLSNVEVLDTIGWGHAYGTIGQLQSFSTITSTGHGANAQILIGLSGEGGVLDFSSRMTASQSVWVFNSGVTSGYAITGSLKNDYLTGSGFVDVLSGGDGDDSIEGQGGNDFLKGGAGVDDLHGGAGVDTVDYSDKSLAVSVVLTGGYANVMVGGLVEDTIWDIENVIGGSGADSLTGDEGANLLVGGAGADTLSGGAGDDVLKGGLGKDVLDGGADIDTADYSDRSGAVALTLAGAANARAVVAGAIEDIVRNIENVFGGSSDDRLTGDGAANRLFGGAGNDILKGGLGSDALNGGADVDTADYGDRTASVSVTLAGGWEVELSVGGVVEDTLQNIENVIGGSGADILNGDQLANSLDGGEGADVMAGGLGDDIYVVDQSGDVVMEAADQGTDTVNAWVDWTLGANVEQLRLMGTADLNGTGNGLNNALFGNAGKNVLNGGAGADTMTGGRGDDTYIVDQSDDVVVELTNGGTDLAQSSAASYRLGANVENLVLTGDGSIAGTGNLGRNELTGNAGNNLLDGGAGADTMAGGEGDDTYVVDNVGDVVTELTNGGTDVVRSSVSHVLSANVENLTLLGKAKLNATGNELDNLLTGNGGRNVLDGGLGADVLAGGGGGDTFRFSTALGPDNVDRIVLFNHKADTIQLDDDVFAALGTGALAAGSFNLGAVASQADDRILFDTASKSLYYDADGLGGTDAVRFATIDALQGVLDHTDFLIV